MTNLSLFDTGMSSHLTHGMQYVKMCDALSSYMECTIGVPQGSVLGPSVFNLCIIDVPLHCPNIDLQRYVDDSVMYTHANIQCKRELVAAMLKTALGKLTHWLNQSCLSLNVSKTRGHVAAVFPL